METIFNHNPTPDELASLDNDYSGADQEKYIIDLERRAKVFNSSKEYEAFADLQHLMKLRDDKEGLEKYTKILEEDFAEITNRIFNE